MRVAGGWVGKAGDLWRCGGGVAFDNPLMDKSKARIVLRFALVALFALLALSIGLVSQLVVVWG